MNQLVSDVLELSTSASSNVKCCRCQDTGSCSGCSCKKAGRGCLHCLPYTKGRCLNRPRGESDVETISRVGAVSATGQTPAPSAPVCSCLEIQSELVRLTKVVEELQVAVQRLLLAKGSPVESAVPAEEALEEHRNRRKDKSKAKESLQSKTNDVRPRKVASTHSVQVSKKSVGNSLQELHASHGKRSRVPVDNARKIWGTIKDATSSTVHNAIKRGITNLDSLSVKRKFVAHDGVTKKWWFVVRGTKADIERLESEWDKVGIQTGWKLQPLLSFPVGTDQSHSNTCTSPIVTDNAIVVTGIPVLQLILQFLPL